jgi:hypothetical protein
MLVTYWEKKGTIQFDSSGGLLIIHGPVSLRKPVSSLHSKSISIRLKENCSVAFPEPSHDSNYQGASPG